MFYVTLNKFDFGYLTPCTNNLSLTTRNLIDISLLALLSPTRIIKSFRFLALWPFMTIFIKVKDIPVTIPRPIIFILVLSLILKVLNSVILSCYIYSGKGRVTLDKFDFDHLTPCTNNLSLTTRNLIDISLFALLSLTRIFKRFRFLAVRSFMTIFIKLRASLWPSLGLIIFISVRSLILNILIEFFK